MNVKLLLVFFLMSFSLNSLGQGKIEDYQRAELLNGTIQNKILQSPSIFKWLNSKQAYFYTLLTERGTEYRTIAINNLTISDSFDQQKLAEKLTDLFKKPFHAYQLPVSRSTINSDGTVLEFNYDNKIWTCDLATYALKEVKNSPNSSSSSYWGDQENDQPNRKTKSPDGKWMAFIKNFNVYIQSTIEKSNAVQLSFDGAEGEYYSEYIAWSPDSKKIATNKVRPNKPHLIYFVESSPTTQLQPILQSRSYLKPGDALPQMQPSLFLIDTKKQIKIDQSGIQSQYSLTNLTWRKDSRAFTFEYNQRGHQKYSVLEVSTTGVITTLVTEESKTFISYSGKKYRYDLGDGKEMIWASERDGWNHLYLYGNDGKVKNQITSGNWVIRNVVFVNESDRFLIFEGSGMEKDQDP